jgi:FO synthase
LAPAGQHYPGRCTEVAMTDLTWMETVPLPELMAQAARRRDEVFGRTVSYSRKVFIPLTKLCRDVCHYCTFAERPRPGHAAYLSADEILDIARAGEAAGCTEALFTLGDKPELRYRAAREALAELGHETTISYLRAMCALVLKETTLLPHVNPGVMTREEIAGLREVSASQGIMLESTSERLCAPGGVHFGSPDKLPAVRLETLRLAGELSVPFTTGILIGIGETRAERLDALAAIRDLHAKYGHVQEVIVQNFRAKPDTKLAGADEPDLLDLLWTIAAARLILPDDVHVQAPPNLSPGVYQKLIDAGIDDWGGVSPVTPDHVDGAKLAASGGGDTGDAACGRGRLGARRRLGAGPDFRAEAARRAAQPGRSRPGTDHRPRHRGQAAGRTGDRPLVRRARCRL